MNKRRISAKFLLYFLMLMFLMVTVGCSSSDDDVIPPAPGPTTYTYTVTFDSQDATTAANPTSKTVTSPATTVVTLPAAPTKTGYNFAGWWTETGGTGTEFTASTAVTADITVYAHWSIAPVYTVTYNSQNGTPVDAQHVTAPTNSVGTLPAPPTYTGYTFAGWWKGTGGTGTQFTAGTVVTADITVYAKWNSYSYTVTFDTQGGTGTSPSSKTVVSPTTTVVTLPTQPTRTGYTFAGWWTGIGGSGTELTATTVVTATIRVYAYWSANPVYTVTFDSQGGTAVGARHVTLPAMTLVTLPAAPTYTGYIFGGWYTGVGGTGAAFTADTVVTTNMTVYAYWED